MNVWFISQGAMFDVEDRGSFVRAPSENGIGKHIRINYIAEGDAVILYHATHIYAVGFYKNANYTRYDDGTPCRVVELDRVVFKKPIPKLDVSGMLRNVQPPHNAPFNRNLDVNQGYCFFANESMLRIIKENCGDEEAVRQIDEKIQSFSHIISTPYDCGAPSDYDFTNATCRRPVATRMVAPPRLDYEEDVFTDPRDGKSYRTIKLAGKTWLADNLQYKCDSGIFHVNNNPHYDEDYGFLYTWDSAQKACPEGWHIPTDEEWKGLFDAVGGSVVALLELENYYGFSFPKSGCKTERLINGKNFASFKEVCCVWSATVDRKGNASRWSMSDKTGEFNPYFVGKTFGFSVRCVKDDE